MAKEFNFEARYAAALSTLQAEIDQCRENLHRYAATPMASPVLISHKSEHIQKMVTVMRFLLSMTGVMSIEKYGHIERFIRELMADPQLTEGHLVFRKETGQPSRVVPSYLTISINQINVDPCTFL